LASFADGTLLIAGIISMYEFHNHMKLILLLMYSFWIPQIISNVIHDSRKPLDPHYILGITVTRLAIPLYIFGWPNNFMHIEPDKNWCVCLTMFLGLQAMFLLLQHYLGPRWFIPRQVRSDSFLETLQPLTHSKSLILLSFRKNLVLT
jgi:hypothetical protein